MSTCDTCKWWQATDFILNPYHPDEEKRLREIEVTTRDCKNPKLDGDIDVRSQLLDATEARPFAADEHGIGLMTGAKFGCIHHHHKLLLSDP